MAAAHSLAQSGNHTALDPAGVHAERIASLWWWFFWVGVVVWVLVMLFMIIGVVRSRTRAPSLAADAPDTSPDPKRSRRMATVVSGAVAITTIVLIVLMLSEYSTSRSLAAASRETDAVRIKLIGHQWWWEIEYEDPIPSQRVRTANELHIPVGRPVRIQLDSVDVIHSLWVPNLHGKRDLIPGHPTAIWLRAQEAATFEGRCAEFCGHQHANMRIIVVAEPQEQFDAWLAAQRQPAPEPVSDVQKRGRDVFMSTTCIMCHTIRGTEAFGRVGPDLTHIASRQVIAAGAAPNRPGHLAGWIIDPQKVKPGVRMPQHSFPPGDLRALLEYLETLK